MSARLFRRSSGQKPLNRFMRWHMANAGMKDPVRKMKIAIAGCSFLVS
jgi:hypothetical protein